MTRNILILDGHPDPESGRYVHALAAAYRDGAEQGKHEPVEAVRRCQDAMNWATHVVILYPLWLGSMPALLKALLEQMLRPGFAFSARKLGSWPVKFMRGKSVRIVVTMGMPAAVYRWFFGAHSLRSLQRNILKTVGFRPVRATVIGSVASVTAAKRAEWLDVVRELGRAAA